MTDYVKYPRPGADMRAKRSAKPQKMATKGGSQHGAKGAMGKHTKTGDGTYGGSDSK